MEAYKLSQEMKRNAVLVTLSASHSDLEISNFLNVAKSFRLQGVNRADVLWR